MSAAVKSLTGSDRVKVTLAVCPLARALVLALRAMVGGVVSTVNGVIGVVVV